MSEFYDKYLKYKNKYLNLKIELAQDGGVACTPQSRSFLILYNSTTNFGIKMNQLKDNDYDKEKTILNDQAFIDPNVFQYEIGTNKIKSMLYFGFKNSLSSDTKIQIDQDIKKLKPKFEIKPNEKKITRIGHDKDDENFKQFMNLTNDKFNATKDDIRVKLDNLINSIISKLSVNDWTNTPPKPGNLRSEIEKVKATINNNLVVTAPLFKGIDSVVLVTDLKKNDTGTGLKFKILKNLVNLSKQLDPK